MTSATAANAACISLPWLQLLHCHGPDAAAFLDQQLTINVSPLTAGEAAIGCWCDARGRSLCTLWVQRSSVDEALFRLALHQSLLPLILPRMQLFILRSAVTLTVADEEQMAVCANSDDWTSMSCWQHLQCRSSAACASDPALARRWAAHEIDSGFIWLDQHSSGQYLPQMLAMSRWRALNFAKGCFPGQEVIARAHYLGRVKRRLYHFSSSNKAATQLQIGDPVLDHAQQPQGEIVNLVSVSSTVLAADQNNEADKPELVHGLAMLQSKDNAAHRVLCCAGNDVNFTLID